MSKTIAAKTPPSLPIGTIAEIGRRIAALDVAFNDADRLLSAGEPTQDTLRIHNKAKFDLDFADDQRDALRGLVLTMRAETTADAVVQGLLALDELSRVESGDLNEYDHDLVLRNVHRALLSITAVAARAADIDVTHLFDGRAPAFPTDMKNRFPLEAQP